jgi:hypothetical protein
MIVTLNLGVRVNIWHRQTFSPNSHANSKLRHDYCVGVHGEVPLHMLLPKYNNLYLLAV